MKDLTIIMPFLNEENEPYETIKSIYSTCNTKRFDIIAIDDCSPQKYDFGKFPDVKYIRNHTRSGVDACRQMGAEIANTPYLFIIDAHMRFRPDDWLNKTIECLKREPTTAWCTVCVGLGYGTMDINKNKGKYHGADMLFVAASVNKNRPSRECLEPKWTSAKPGLEYEIPCILGANYGFTKEWFNHIRGLKGLKSWGSSEPFLSLKTYMAGGKCKIRTDIEIGHKFRDNAPYTTQIGDLYYNKIYICKTLFPDEFGQKIINCLPKDTNFSKAQAMIEENKNFIEESRKYYKGIFVSSIYDYCKKFNINLPS